MMLLLFILGGLTLGFSLLFFVAPQQINKRNVAGISIGGKPKEKGTEELINRIVFIDGKISAISVSMGLFLLAITIILFWMGYTLIK